MCDLEGFNVGVRGERLIDCGGIVGKKVGDELTSESSLVILFRFVRRTVGAEDKGTIRKVI